MNDRNFQREMDKRLENATPDTTLLLHACCAPCSSYCLTYLKGKVKIKIYYYNPNIVDGDEYRKRADELKRLVDIINEEGVADDTKEEASKTGQVDSGHKDESIEFLEGPHEPEKFLEAVKGLENEPEGGARCAKCFELRLREAARKAKAEGALLLTTTLTISPLKNATLINEIGERVAMEEGLEWLPSDFKKKEGYKQSVELSEKYGLYRQNFCGCPFSLRN